MTDETSGYPPRLCLVRHGQGSLGTDDYDRLSPAGQRQARLTGERLADHYPSAHRALWSGSLRRHRQTLACIDEAERATISEDLNEYRVDRLIEAARTQAGLLDLEVPGEQAFADPQAYLQTFLEWFPSVLDHWQQARLDCPDNGPWQHFHARVRRPLALWQTDLVQGRDTVVVTSAGVISTLVSELTGQDLAYQRQLNVELLNASVSELVLDQAGRWQVLRLNCVEHLDAELHTLA
ncbi:MAG: histidine phosphatase family protein [Wenzhouxiangella sp.]